MRERAQCPVCKRRILVNRDGSIRRHRPYHYTLRRCHGSGQRVLLRLVE